MKEIKRKLALVLTVCMVLNTVIPAYADEIAAPEETAVQQEASDIAVSEINDDAEPEETVPDEISYEDKTILENIEKATPANADYIKPEEAQDDSDIDIPEEATPANAKYTDETFIRETVVDGIKITLTADPGVFPEDAELWAEKVEDEATEEDIEEAVEKERDNNANVALSYKFDIKVFVNGEEVQPNTSKGSVRVTFTLAEELSECLDANAYHLKENAKGEFTAENLGAEVKTVEEAVEEETTKEAGDNSETVKTVIVDEDGIPADGTIEDDVTKKVTKLEAETDGFSYYVVEFTYQLLRYTLVGTSAKLSNILSTLDIMGTPSEATVNDAALLSVTPDEEGEDWTVNVLQSFDLATMSVTTVNDNTYEINVSNAIDSATRQNIKYIDENGAESSQDCIIMTSADGYTFEAGEWYAVTGDVTIKNRIINNAEKDTPAHLILVDEKNLTASQGINTTNGKGLVIYGQSAGTGKLYIPDAPEYSAGIGSGKDDSGGDIIINGGTINAAGGYLGAGIGSGLKSLDVAYTTAGNITINGGTVIANGGYVGAGIGGGLQSNGGSITINGGTVTATGGSDGGGGIGGGKNSSGGSVTINGGTVTATGGSYGAGIGGGKGSSGENITINEGTVTATGGSYGAGIGGGADSSGGNITINGGTVTATGGKTGTAAIGGGFNTPEHGTITLDARLEILAGTSAEDCRHKSVELYSFSRDTYARVHAIPTYTITWKDWDGKLLASVQVEKGGLPVYPLSSKPARSGYIFTGWNKDITLATADTTYTATYEKKSSGGGGGGGSGSGGGGGSAVIAYAEKPAVTPITVAANGSQMMGTAVVSIPAAQLAKNGAVPVAGTWKKASGMWAFTKADGNKAKNEWVLITVAGGNASYFYFDSNGNMVTGWQRVGGKWMYFNNESGSLLGACLRGPGRTPDGYEIDATGAWTGR